MKSQSHHADVPDFLHNSPFFLPELHEFKADRRARKKPTWSEILRSKPSRFVAYAILAIIVFLYLKHKSNKIHLWDRLTGPSCYYKNVVEPPLHYGDSQYGDSETDWSRFAYALYATDTEYLCNTLMLFETLHRLDSKADRILLYPKTFDMTARSNNKNTELLIKAENEYSVKLIPIDVQHNNLAYYSGPNWADSYTKLLAFNQTQYARLIVLDSDSTLFSPLDELFFLPPSTIALSRAYWIDKPTMSSHIMLIEPSASSFQLIEEAIKDAKSGNTVYDMEIINSLFGSSPSCLRLPHRIYALLTGEFRRPTDSHDLYFDELAIQKAEWNPDAAIMEAKFVHFSDHPMGKPWVVERGQEGWYGYEPECVEDYRWENRGPDRGRDCRARNAWVDLLDDFKKKRKRVCGM